MSSRSTHTADQAHRRQFRLLLVGPSLALACLALGGIEVAAEGGRKYEFSQDHMGTRFRLLFYADSDETANGAAEAAFSRIAELEKVFSSYDPQSEARRICSTAPVDSWVPVSRDLWRVLKFAQAVSKETGGAFDVTVGPLTRLWRQARRRKRPPDREKLARALETVGYRYLDVDPHQPRIRLKKARMRLDFGGIAKGDALDQALKTLAQHGIKRAIVDGGGDLAAGEAPPTSQSWKITLSRLEKGKTGLTIELPAGQAIATSGDLHQFLLVNGKRYSHLIDPRSGEAIRGRRQVSVIAESGIASDAWASALSVLPVRKALEIVSKQKQLGMRMLVETGVDGQVNEHLGGSLSCLFSAKLPPNERQQ